LSAEVLQRISGQHKASTCSPITQLALGIGLVIAHVAQAQTGCARFAWFAQSDRDSRLGTNEVFL